MSTDDPLWIAIPATDPLSAETHGEHRVEFVSRHAIAEAGLICPVCGTEVAPLGDYIMVRHCRLGDVIKCNGKRQLQDAEVTCGAYLVASPDTEHGDHILYDKVPGNERFELFYRFVRVSEGDAVRLKYGEDLRKDEYGNLIATPTETPQRPALPTLQLEAGQVWQTDDGRQVSIARVQTDGDPVFHGWAWGYFLNSDGIEWNIDPTGLIRQTMRDPTLNDRVRLTSLIRQL